MNTILLVPPGSAGTCPKCGATKTHIHRNIYRHPVVGGVQGRNLYTCFNTLPDGSTCNAEFTEGQALPEPTPPPKAEPVRLPGADATPPKADPPYPPEIKVIGPGRSPASGTPRPREIAQRVELERILHGLNLGTDSRTPADDVLAEVRKIRSASNLRAVHVAARHLAQFLHDYAGTGRDFPLQITADPNLADKFTALNNQLRAALGHAK